MNVPNRKELLEYVHRETIFNHKIIRRNFIMNEKKRHKCKNFGFTDEIIFFTSYCRNKIRMFCKKNNMEVEFEYIENNDGLDEEVINVYTYPGNHFSCEQHSYLHISSFIELKELFERGVLKQEICDYDSGEHENECVCGQCREDV